MAAIISKLFDEVFVCLSQFVFWHVGDGEDERGEMFDEIAQNGIREAVFVRPLGIAEDTIELVGVGLFDLTHGFLYGKANVAGLVAYIMPVSALRNLEAMVFCEGGVGYITFGFIKRALKFFVIQRIAERLI